MQTTRTDYQIILFKFYRRVYKNKLRFVMAMHLPTSSVHPALTPDADRYADMLSEKLQERVLHQFQIEY